MPRWEFKYVSFCRSTGSSQQDVGQLHCSLFGFSLRESYCLGTDFNFSYYTIFHFGFPLLKFFCKLSSVISTLSVNRNNVGQNKDKASPPRSHLLSGCSSCIVPFTMSNLCKFMQIYANWALVIIRLNGFSMVSLENYPHCGNKSLRGCWLW